MTEKQIRFSILDALDAAYSKTTKDELARENILSGSVDYTYEELDLDSFGMMEFCISLEVNGVISIEDDKVIELNTLNNLVEFIYSEHNA